ncbi:hypothetical protein KC19_10G189000 [Ceratodon purpureus]|uniref:DUF4042 domain-containing protein n=2 Tax=Ceratodon purpureus TaxID=3225 RepID=A0A8T0GPN4_CERPU|nr:hypothetical protein KC19_10G189000 [Ceratodon purpureus]
MTDQQRQHLAGGRPWRWVFESLRAAQEPASLIPNLLLLTPNIVHCCSQLPAQEVADDVQLIVQAVSDRWLPIDGAEASRICRLTCIFIRNVFQCLQLVFNEDSRLALMHFFQGTITSASTVILLGEEGGTEAGRAKVEAVAGLGQFLLQALNGGLFSVDDVSEVVLFLSGLIQYPAIPVSAQQSISGSHSEAQHASNIDEMEVQRLAFVVVGSLMSQSRSLVSGEAWTSAVQAFLVILDSLASKNALVEDYAAARYYVDLLRSVYITVSKPEERLKEHVRAFVIALRVFFHYGLNVSQGEATTSSTWQEKDTGRSYHRMEEFELPTNNGSVCMPDTADSFSFDPSESPGGIAAEVAFLDKSSELRMYSIGAIQAIARADPKGFQKCSALLLLPDDLEQPRSDETTLLNILRFEPLAKIRAAAATTLVVMLECPMYACCQDTDLAREGLSGCERQIFLELQAGLVHTVLNEKHNGTLLATLKALSLFISTAPFSQLPLELLSTIVLSISKRLRESNYFLTQSSLLTAAIACFRASLSIPPSSTQLYYMLSKETSAGLGNLRVSRSLLVELITYSQAPAPTAVQIEAIQALKAAAHNYPGVLAPYWDDIFKVLVRVIDSGTFEGQSGASDDGYLFSTAYAKNISSGLVQGSRLSDEELVRSAIELLDELLRVASDIEEPGEERDSSSLKSSLSPQLSEAPESVKLLCSPRFGTHKIASASDSMASEKSEEDGSLQWLLALERLLPVVLRHSSPMIRGAGLSCLAGLTPAVFCSLPAPKQEFILSTIMRASQYDDTPAVRSAACRAVGVIVGFPQASKSHDHVAAFMSMLILRMEHSSTPESISVSWALANLCDGLCSYCAFLGPMEAERILGHLPIESLFACIFKAAKDSEIKVCINALRAMGKLARILNFKNAPCVFSGEVIRSRIDIIDLEVLQARTSSDWLGTVVQVFRSCSTSESVEVQWNTCYAVGELFQNRSIHLSTSLWATILFDLLQSLLRGSESLEVKMHAAAALRVPAFREDYGTAFEELVRILVQLLILDLLLNQLLMNSLQGLYFIYLDLEDLKTTSF